MYTTCKKYQICNNKKYYYRIYVQTNQRACTMCERRLERFWCEKKPFFLLEKYIPIKIELKQRIAPINCTSQNNKTTSRIIICKSCKNVLASKFVHTWSKKPRKSRLENLQKWKIQKSPKWRNQAILIINKSITWNFKKLLENFIFQSFRITCQTLFVFRNRFNFSWHSKTSFLNLKKILENKRDSFDIAPKNLIADYLRTKSVGIWFQKVRRHDLFLVSISPQVRWIYSPSHFVLERIQ